jgi:CheY-like chemotaxis protein
MALVLVIDDDWSYRSILRRILESRGHDVAEASSGDEGLEIYEERGPAIVITDMLMAGMDGDEVIRTIRRIGEPVGIIAVSGGCAFYNVDATETAEKLGVDAILRKLDPKERILTEVDRILNMRH